jgi:hypothetical protein
MKDSYSNDYANGLLASITRTAYFIEGKIAKIKEQKPESNSPRQITNGGKLKAYNDVLSYLKSKQKIIINNSKLNAERTQES